jgi:hypothetical protein
MKQTILAAILSLGLAVPAVAESTDPAVPDHVIADMCEQATYDFTMDIGYMLQVEKIPAEEIKKRLAEWEAGSNLPKALKDALLILADKLLDPSADKITDEYAAAIKECVPMLRDRLNSRLA